MHPSSTHVPPRGTPSSLIVLRYSLFLFLLSAYVLGLFSRSLPVFSDGIGGANVRPQYITLRYGGGDNAPSLPKDSLIAGDAAALTAGGKDVNRNSAIITDNFREEEGRKDEAEAEEQDVLQGEEETEKMWAREQRQEEDGDEEKEGAIEEAQRDAGGDDDLSVRENEGQRTVNRSSAPFPSSSSSSSSSSSWPPPSWAWPLNPEHQAYGDKAFGIRFPPTPPSLPSSFSPSNTTCTGTGVDETEDIDFTLVSQTSPDRLWMLPHVCQRWQGPIVLAIYMQNANPAHEAFLSEITDCPHARILQVSPPPSPPSASSSPESSSSSAYWGSPDHYPVNALRNLAIAEVTTTHFLLTDMDLWPSLYLYSLLKHLSSKRGEGGGMEGGVGRETRERFLDPLQALVVPAFGYLGKTTTADHGQGGKSEAGREGLVESMPQVQKGLLACLGRGDCLVFDSQYNVHGHGSTDTLYWTSRQGEDEVKAIPCFLSNRYEPYVVLRRCPTTPPFAEAFTGYGKNKIEHIAHLRHRGFSFSVLPPQAFLVHFPHPTSSSKKSWLTGKREAGKAGWRERMDEMYSRFLYWASQERASRSNKITHLCPSSYSTAVKP